MRGQRLPLGLALLVLSGTACQQPRPPQAAPPPVSESGAFRRLTPEQSGLSYTWKISGERPLDILQTIGNGVAFLDYDADGNLDILCVGSPAALFRGDGKGHFTDVSATVLPPGLSDHFLGVAVGDVDGDGFDDLYLSAYEGGRLLHNQGGKSFEDATARFGLPHQPWGTSCAFFDSNSDGRLDLYIGNYVVFGPKSQRLCSDGTLSTSCGPRHYSPHKGKLYLQSATGRFQEAPLPSTSGKVLGVGFAPAHNGYPMQLALANDEMPGDLLSPTQSAWKNSGDLSGTAFDGTGAVHGGMGLDWGDVNGDGTLDLAVMTFQNEDKCLYLGTSPGLFTESSLEYGLKSAYSQVAFGCKFLDFDNSGTLDLIIANGHVQSNADEITKGATYRQSLQLFENQEGKHFKESSEALGESARVPIVGRGLATGDFNNDGNMDVLVVDSEGAPLLLQNQGQSSNGWIGFALSQPAGKPGGANAYGALITVTLSGKKRIQHCHSDGSYLSASDSRVHFGLGSARKVDAIQITWPDGKTEDLGTLEVGKYWRVVRGQKTQ